MDLADYFLRRDDLLLTLLKDFERFLSFLSLWLRFLVSFLPLWLRFLVKLFPFFDLRELFWELLLREDRDEFL